MQQPLPKPKFFLLTEFAQKVHDELNGEERKKTLDQLEQWQTQMRKMSYSLEEREKMQALDEAFELAKKITKRAFFAPWECQF